MNKGYIILIISFVVICTLKVSSQEEPKPSFKERLYLGGDFSAWIGRVSFINIGPKVGYRFNNRFSAGPGIRYLYISERGFEPYNAYGGGVFSRFQVLDQLFLHAEYEYLSVKAWDTHNGGFTRLPAEAFLIGGGFTQRLGAKSAFNIIGLWNLLDGATSRYPFPNPIIQMGFGIGL